MQHEVINLRVLKAEEEAMTDSYKKKAEAMEKQVQDLEATNASLLQANKTLACGLQLPKTNQKLEEEANEASKLAHEVSILKKKYTEAKKRADKWRKIAAEFEEIGKRSLENQGAMQRQVEEMQAANEKLDKFIKEIQAELEDMTIKLDYQRIIEAHEKETKVLSSTRELDELNDGREGLQAELDELVNKQSAADKKVHELEKTKCLLESKIAEQQAQIEGLKAELKQIKENNAGVKEKL